MDETDAAPPGWYPDPTMHNTMRFWDGTQWTEQNHPGQVAAPPVSVPTNGGLLAVGYIGALVLPLVGLVVGAMLIGKDNNNAGGIIALSLAAMVVLYSFAF